jgi:hypothetical protein
MSGTWHTGRVIRALTLACLIIGLASEIAVGPANASGKTVLVLIDISRSVRNQETKALYLDSFKRVTASVTHGDVLVAGWITEKSEDELELPIHDRLPAFRPNTDNPLFVRAERAKADQELEQRRKQICNDLRAQMHATDKRQVEQTAIIDSLDLAQRVFASFHNGDNVLVLMSDMVEDSGSYNFYRENLTPARVRGIIAQLKLQERVPDLSGVKVFVVGANYLDNDRFRKIRNFWLSFFSATRADLRPENYGAALVDFSP